MARGPGTPPASWSLASRCSWSCPGGDWAAGRRPGRLPGWDFPGALLPAPGGCVLTLTALSSSSFPTCLPQKPSPPSVLPRVTLEQKGLPQLPPGLSGRGATPLSFSQRSGSPGSSASSFRSHTETWIRLKSSPDCGSPFSLAPVTDAVPAEGDSADLLEGGKGMDPTAPSSA